jgi:hypothetical protein
MLMEDIVAVAITTDTGTVCYALTWGRIQDTVDPTALEAVVLANARRFGTPGTPVSAKLCGTLQEAAGAPWFYENFFDFCQNPIPFGPKYKKWRKRIRRRMEAG